MRKVVVTRFDGSEQSDLNELEFIDSLVCCNIWYMDEIICVDPVTGKSVREYGKCTCDAKCLIDSFKAQPFLDISLSMNNRPVFIATERKQSECTERNSTWERSRIDNREKMGPNVQNCLPRLANNV